ncbi:SET and MYND domain-containing protein 4-like [Polistes fuscatus]|uniref:SET and MYND domain-containing protein 4-like n=1 Tax=Polistes fuscatus TaxID=30207 RepID=UPI001CA866F4|nr:SET and MYND domain-containing protein 4-like [Polistes fuscatus]
MLAVHSLLTRRIEDGDKVSEIMKDFNTKDNDFDRIRKILQVMVQFDVTPKIPLLTKECVLSTKYRDMGNNLYFRSPAPKKINEIIINYTKSVAHGAPLSEELGMAYVSRSGILLYLRQFKDSISDIDRALTFNLPDDIKLKIYLRRIKCLLELGQSIDDDYTRAFNMIQEMPDDHPKKQKSKERLDCLKDQLTKIDTQNIPNKQKYKIKIPVIESPNVEVPSASDAVSVVYNSSKYERHIVAARDIEPGELIAVEKGYSHIVDTSRVYSHCTNCSDCCLALIPCDYCYIAMYCSDKCRDEHWQQYHEIECRVFSILYEMSDVGASTFNCFCIRLVLRAFREFGSIESLRSKILQIEKRNKQLDPRTQGFDSDMKFHSDKYYSKFFGDKKGIKVSEIAQDEDMIFIGGLILSHQQIISSNFHDLEEIRGFDSSSKGMISLAFCSLFNHSCMPNVIRYPAKTTMVVRALHPIAKGEQIFDNYGNHYAITVRSRRREDLLSNYYFYCECLPCREHWRTNPELLSVEELLKPPINKSFILKSLENLNNYILFIASADSKTIEEKQDIIDSLRNMLRILYEHSLYPSVEFSKISETIRHAYSMFGNVHFFPPVKKAKLDK